MKIYYLIYKLYKGLLRKKFKYNISVLIIPIEKDLSGIFSIVGELKDNPNKYVLSLEYTIKSKLIPDYLIEAISPEHNHVLITESSCNKKIHKNKYDLVYTLNSPGKYLPKTFTLSSHEVQEKIYFFIEGKFNFIDIFEDVSNDQLRMTSKKHKAFSSGFVSKIKDIINKIKGK